MSIIATPPHASPCRAFDPSESAALQAPPGKPPPTPCRKTPYAEPPTGPVEYPEQFLILVTCRDEKEHVELLRRFQQEDWQCKALVG